jgi:hypothetical protein
MLLRLARESLMAKAPNTVLWVCGTVVAVAILICITVLSYFEKDADTLVRVINTVLNAAGVLLGGGAFVYSASAAKRADDAASTVENGDLDRRIRSAVARVLATDTAEGRAAATDGPKKAS